jgi:hypothetical protein
VHIVEDDQQPGLRSGHAKQVLERVKQPETICVSITFSRWHDCEARPELRRNARQCGRSPPGLDL